MPSSYQTFHCRTRSVVGEDWGMPSTATYAATMRPKHWLVCADSSTWVLAGGGGSSLACYWVPPLVQGRESNKV